MSGICPVTYSRTTWARHRSEEHTSELQSRLHIVCRLMLEEKTNDLGPLFQFAYAQGARIHSNSWGGGDPGVYDDQCRQFDAFVWCHKDFCFVIAAGNGGSV